MAGQGTYNHLDEFLRPKWQEGSYFCIKSVGQDTIKLVFWIGNKITIFYSTWNMETVLRVEILMVSEMLSVVLGCDVTW
jgi:hypothetical protein